MLALAAATQLVAAQAASNGGVQTALEAANAKARETARAFLDDYYEKRIFDPYLQFASAEEEAAFRKREAERKEAIERAVAENTPAGSRRALNLSIEQLDDAARFGADRSPEFASRRADMVASRDELDRATPPAKPAPANAEEKADAALAALRAAGVTVADENAPASTASCAVAQSDGCSRA